MPAWLKNAVFYEIYPQSFYDSNGDGIGDIPGITLKLDYIQSLGCNALWINPCFDSPFHDAGYDVRDYKKVAARYGTNEDLKACFEEAHKRGIRVLLDLVPCHTSYQHEWFQQSQKADRNEYTDRYIWTDAVWNRPANLGSISGMSERDGCYILSFFASQPALNFGFSKVTAPWQYHYTDPECLATREALKDIMRFWLDAGCDGFRVDMAGALVKQDEGGHATAEIWHGIRQMLDKEYPEAAMVAEWSDPVSITEGGFHMDFCLDHEGMGYNSLFRKTGHNGAQLSFFSRQGNGDIMEFLSDYEKRYEAAKSAGGYISLISCNHDTPRLTKHLDDKECALAYAFLFAMPGVPFLYYGDEIGMQYFKLKSLEGGYERTGTRTPMQWDNGKNLGFSTADEEKLYLPVDGRGCAPTVEKQEKDPASLLNMVRKVIALRQSDPDLQSDGAFEVVYAEKGQYPFVFRRGKYLVAVNPSWRKGAVPMTEQGEDVFHIGNCSLDGAMLRMDGQSFGIFQTKA